MLFPVLTHNSIDLGEDGPTHQPIHQVISCCIKHSWLYIDFYSFPVLTHDSIGLGEDGPTHQPIEQIPSFRAMPNTLVVRPAGGNETAGAYKVSRRIWKWQHKQSKFWTRQISSMICALSELT